MVELHEAKLVDAVERAHSTPSTFIIPDRDERTSVKVGDLVQVGFQHETAGAERIWIKVQGVDLDTEEGKWIYHGEVYSEMEKFTCDEVVEISEDSIMDIKP